jgi:hypothetical protein
MAIGMGVEAVIANLTDFPLAVLALSFVLMWLAARIGWAFQKRQHSLDKELREDFTLILGSALTLLGLVIGFSFAISAGRYDQRKNYEEAEANAIGTEFLRADLLPEKDAARVREILKKYLEQRILFYSSDDEAEVEQINAKTGRMQNELWQAILPSAKADNSSRMALVISGMNDVLNSQGYTQSAWWYRLPSAAWALMILIAVGCNVLIGYGSPEALPASKLLFILPLLISIAFMLIADIDSPRRGVIRVHPQNLISLADSLREK